MEMKVKTINSELTLVGYWSRQYCEYVEVSKHYDTDFNGKKKSFWRVDIGGRTISTLNRTKADAIRDARKFMKKRKEEDMERRERRGY